MRHAQNNAFQQIALGVHGLIGVDAPNAKGRESERAAFRGARVAVGVNANRRRPKKLLAVHVGVTNLCFARGAVGVDGVLVQTHAAVARRAALAN